jgi:ferric-dicitrate binding protein FerR (iron transport regulator)
VFTRPYASDTPPGMVSLSEKVFEGRQHVYLPDGTIVVLKDNAVLRFNTALFDKQDRTVRLEGEAFFDVRHDVTKPFIVQAGAINTRVLGTSFGVRALPGDNTAEVAVTRGLVEVSNRNGKLYGRVGRGEALVVDLEKELAAMRAIDHTSEVWRQHLVVFNKTNLDVAAAMIEERFRVKVLFKHESLRTCDAFSAAFYETDNVDTVMTAIAKLFNDAGYTTLPDGQVMFNAQKCSR